MATCNPRSPRRRARRRLLRGEAEHALRLGRGMGRQPADAARTGRYPCRAAGGRPAPLRNLVVAAYRARESGAPLMIFADEPAPGYPLPILPGHSSPGRFERVLRAGAFAVTAELSPPDSADPKDVYAR